MNTNLHCQRCQLYGMQCHVVQPARLLEGLGIWGQGPPLESRVQHCIGDPPQQRDERNNCINTMAAMVLFSGHSYLFREGKWNKKQLYFWPEFMSYTS